MKMQIFEPFTFLKKEKKATTAVQLNKIYLESHSFGIIIRTAKALPRHPFRKIFLVTDRFKSSEFSCNLTGKK